MAIIYDHITLDSQILLTDSRFLSAPENSTFVAIKGVHHNGHDFIQDLYAKGIKSFIVEKAEIDKNSELKNFLENTELKAYLVDNAIKAIQVLAAEKRNKYKYPIIGITGSNGKTIVKEWLNTVLQDDFTVVKSPRSYNSQIGVALSVWEMADQHNLGIFEAGVSQQNEMQNLELIIKPNIGIFTNIGPAHNSGFKSLKQKVTEKLRLFKRSDVLIFCQDYKEINEEINILLKAVNPKIKLLAWSKNSSGSNAVVIKKQEVFSNIICYYEGDDYHFKLPFTDDAAIENAIHCIFVGLYLKSLGKLKSSVEVFLARFELLKSLPMRLELKQAIGGNYIIDDSYNNDILGLKMALNFMNQNHTKRQKVLILSDMLQTGLSSIDFMQNIKQIIAAQNLSFFIGIGPILYAGKEEFSEVKSVFFESTADFMKYFDVNDLTESLILVKGARSFSFESIVNKFIRQVHGTVFEINLNAITNNLNYYRNKIGKDTKIMVMVKAFAYGSGSTEVASLLQYHRVDYLSVAYPDEGVALRESGIAIPIMVLNSAPDTFQKLIDYNLEPEIYSLELMHDFIRFKNKISNSEATKIHLKLDTGMHRLGFTINELPQLLTILNAEKSVIVASIFSHLAGADEAIHNDFSRSQIDTFESFSKQIIQSLAYKPLRHICNSAGIIRFPDAKYDMVRLGIGLYGVEASGIESGAVETVGTLKTTISQIKFIAKADTVGYGRHGVLNRDTQVATIAIGYADGYDRRFSKGVGKVLVNNIMCSVIGNVCMDMTMIDVTDANAKVGDEVIIFGQKPDISTMSKLIGTIPYELLTGVSERVKRIFFYE